ncbi:MAG: T9SS type A sorting domain-containing protein [Bacteroidales bacterium]|nr:T9SS type A sorting domain-containing protein [Bacteroidales bacterium]
MTKFYQLLLVAAMLIGSTTIKAQMGPKRMVDPKNPHALHESICKFNRNCQNRDYTMTVDSVFYNDEIWGENSSYYYQYDWKNRVVQEIQYTWEASKFDYTYDDENGGNLVQVVESYIINKDGGNFEPVYIQHYYYTDGRLTKFEYETYMDYSYWMVTDRTEYEYDEEGNLVALVSSALTDWTAPEPYMDYSSKEVYTYENGQVKTFTYYQYGEGGGFGKDDEWTPILRTEYEDYDANGNYHVSYSYFYGEDWEPSSKEERTYDESNNMTSQIYYYWDGELWIASSKTSFDFVPASNTLNEQLEYEFDGADYYPIKRTVFEYDTLGNRTKALFYTWENEDWTNNGYAEATYENNSADIILGMEDVWNEFSWGIGAYASVFSQWTGLIVETTEYDETTKYEFLVYSSDWASASVNEATTLTHTVYPNPFTHEVRINAAEAVNGSASISVFNVLGEQVISKAMNCSETTEFVIDGSSLNAGIYFYNISTENGELKGRIVKE